jgi:hypothetical protein
VALKKDNRCHTACEGKSTSPPARNSPRVPSSIVPEIAFISFGNLFLGAFWRGHD